MPSVHYFYVKTKILADFQICISVPPLSMYDLLVDKMDTKGKKTIYELWKADKKQNLAATKLKIIRSYFFLSVPKRDVITHQKT